MKARPERQFYFRLAGHLGRTVHELLASISSRELSEWMAYEQVAGPLGGQRTDVAAAIISATLANINREKRSKAYGIDDFMPEWSAEPVGEMSPDAVWSAVEQAHKAFTTGRG